MNKGLMLVKGYRGFSLAPIGMNERLSKPAYGMYSPTEGGDKHADGYKTYLSRIIHKEP